MGGEENTMKSLSRSLIAACCAIAPLAAAAEAGECVELPETSDTTRWNRSRAWIHEAGWFIPLDKPKTILAKGEEYEPVHAMAYHHVANDLVGGQSVVTTY
jgi:hypothetical protein